MPEHEMTPDERERFERERIHHEDLQDSAGPASDSNSHQTQRAECASQVDGTSR